MKNIPNFPGYKITEDGKIWSTLTNKWRKTYIKNNGYLTVSLCADKVYTCLVHRLVLETYIGPCPEGMESCHKDGNKMNNTLSNLTWDTHKANCKARMEQGVHGGPYKLNEFMVRLIRYFYKTGLIGKKELAEIFGVTKENIVSIIKYKSWKFI